MKCRECSTSLPCVNKFGVCKECDGQFKYCYLQCKNTCRDKEEQERLFDKWEPEWRDSMIF